jgi:hypothetical protein
MAGSGVSCRARVKCLTIQHYHSGINFFSIQECNCGIRPIWGKMRSTVWTVFSSLLDGSSVPGQLLKDFLEIVSYKRKF